MRVTFDSNAWEAVFDPTDDMHAPIRKAVETGVVDAFICAAGFAIEAIRKRERLEYFAQPHTSFQMHGVVMRDGTPCMHMSFGPDDKRHPGVPEAQTKKLNAALVAGIQLMRGMSWLGLPTPHETSDPALFVPESASVGAEREQRQINADALICARGVGRTAFEAAGGWNSSPGDAQSEKEFWKACAEWADGELVAAHIGYRNDILCTNDRARSAGRSIFASSNRAWLTKEFGVEFATLSELAQRLAA